MFDLRSILTCLAIASLLVSDVVVVVHSASCSQGMRSPESAAGQLNSGQLTAGQLTAGQSSPAQRGGESKVCGCRQHCTAATSNATENSLPATPAHDSDECTICRGALLCRFAVICDAVLPPAFEELADWVTVTTTPPSLGHEFSSALSERGPPA